MIKHTLLFFAYILIFSNISNANSEVDKSDLIVNEVNQISKNIRCLVCRNETVESSNSQFAIDVRKVIRTKLLEGKNKDYIYKFLQSRYGDYILFDPPVQFNTLMLWLMPFFCLIFGLMIFIFKYVKLRRK